MVNSTSAINRYAWNIEKPRLAPRQLTRFSAKDERKKGEGLSKEHTEEVKQLEKEADRLEKQIKENPVQEHQGQQSKLSFDDIAYAA